MNGIQLRREMAKRGWRYGRRRKGECTFGIRFANGMGVTRVVSIQYLSLCQMTAPQLAAYLTLDACLAAKQDLRTSIAA